MSERITVTVSTNTHERLVERATREGIPLATLCSNILTETTRPPSKEARRLAVKEESGLQEVDRLSRVEAALETLTAATLTLEAVADGMRNLQAGLSRLEAIQEQHIRSHG